MLDELSTSEAWLDGIFTLLFIFLFKRFYIRLWPMIRILPTPQTITDQQHRRRVIG
jgi:hypothetical protein